ncbi:unnamed protein product (macronuclear) [Paramecium tetraurelia]|uniref:Eukaryotic translation initiation factor 4E n=1 Tax=Paramecium tetraurelia TaxID=5888 RepID=A0BLU3_PARTE|nr:uncharacterized protein GSPATT00030144001 [Paramecium tetraurelia]CAK59510.1 unnamed protein product [Paramecium tetraurelia]|eukprot:XP_001426908.1 hypothetical protein (macronuclear) [Paramecium tetraurelia strain d4-2]
MLQLGSDFTFWLGTFKQGQYVQEVIGSFSTAEDFWAYYQHIVRPEQQPEGNQIFLFKKNITPVWEDPQNKFGGRFIFKVRKSLGNQILEELLLSFVGADCDYDEFINGIVCHTKKGFIQMALWVKDIKHNMDAFTTIEKWLKDSILQLKEDRDIEFAFHPLT